MKSTLKTKTTRRHWTTVVCIPVLRIFDIIVTKTHDTKYCLNLFDVVKIFIPWQLRNKNEIWDRTTSSAKYFSTNDARSILSSSMKSKSGFNYSHTFCIVDIVTNHSYHSWEKILQPVSLGALRLQQYNRNRCVGCHRDHLTEDESRFGT